MCAIKFKCIEKKEELDDMFEVTMRSAVFRDFHDNELCLKLSEEQYKRVKIGADIPVDIGLDDRL